MSTEPGTQGAEEIAPITEQQQIRPIETEIPESERAPDAADAPVEPKTTPKDTETVDPRSARLEALADRAHQSRQEEAAAVDEVMLKPVAEAPAIVEPEKPVERVMRLKVNGKEVQMTEAEVIAKAQTNLAADERLEEAKRIVREARELRQPEQQTTQVQQQEKIDNIAKAIEIIQTGGDAAEAKAILDTELTERAARAAENAIDSRSNDERGARYDADYNQGFTEAAADLPELPDNPVLNFTVRGLAGALQAHTIAEHLAALPPETQQAFAVAGITPDALRQNYKPDEAAALYRDMLLKGYRLPYRPSEIVKVAAKTVAERFGTPKPATAQIPEPAPQPSLDRTARKEAIVQPERTTLPKPTGRQPAPRSEAQRATDARRSMRADRRSRSG